MFNISSTSFSPCPLFLPNVTFEECAFCVERDDELRLRGLLLRYSFPLHSLINEKGENLVHIAVRTDSYFSALFLMKQENFIWALKDNEGKFPWENIRTLMMLKVFIDHREEIGARISEIYVDLYQIGAPQSWLDYILSQDKAAELFKAIHSVKSLIGVKALFALGLNFGEKNAFGDTALMSIFFNPQIDDLEKRKMCIFLLQNGAPVNEPNLFGETLLLLVLKMYQKQEHLTEWVALLLNFKASLMTRCSEGYTPYTFTLKYLDIWSLPSQMIRFASSLGSMLYSKEFICHAFQFFQRHENKNILTMLIQNGANINSLKEESSSIFSSMRMERAELVSFLVEYGLDLSKNEYTFEMTSEKPSFLHEKHTPKNF